MVDPRNQLTTAELQQFAPGATLPRDATVGVAEVTAGVYRAAVHGPNGEPLGEHVGTDAADAVRAAIDHDSP